jgi:hypothetical protein
MDGLDLTVRKRHQRQAVAAESAGVWERDRQRRLSTHGSVHGVATSAE